MSSERVGSVVAGGVAGAAAGAGVAGAAPGGGVGAAGGGAAFAFSQLDGPLTVSEIGDAFAAARREADELREHARAEGFAAGHADGIATAAAEAAGGVAALRAAVSEIESLRENVMAEVEQDALSLAFELAEHILAGALAVEPARVRDVARHALRHFSERRQITLVVNPDDLAFMTEAAPELLAELGGIEHLAVQADRRVGRGGAVARTDAGEIDAGIQVQLDRARELVAQALGPLAHEGAGADRAADGP